MENLPEFDVTFAWKDGEMVGRTVFMGRIIKAACLPPVGGGHPGIVDYMRKKVAEEIRLVARDIALEMQSADPTQSSMV